MTQIYKMPIISKVVGDIVSVAIEHLLKMAPRNQIVTDDVKWSRDGKRHVTNGHVTETSLDPDRSRL